MESIHIALTMLAAVLVSGIFVRIIPVPIPLPLVQIALGMLIAGVFEQGVALSPDVFFLLFLPPLLFLDGWRIPKDDLRRDWVGVTLLAFGLVLITVIGVGYVIHWMVPAMPLAVAFALAAIISPTDAVAVGGIARKLGIPNRIMGLIEGEALFNDASGLVAFRVAVVAATTGTFALSSAAGSFVWVSVVGLLSGALVAYGVALLSNYFTERFGEEPGPAVLLSLLIPFAAYFVAEMLNASGILAAVAAGLVKSHSELSGRVSATTRVRRRAIWDMIQFALNGIIFVLLGEQLPRIFEGARTAVEQSGHQNPLWLAVYAVVICVVLAALRFGWIYACLMLSRRLRLQSGSDHSLRALLILSVGGVRGAVTLAGVMTLPLLLESGEPFPARDLAIFLASSVIIISLVVASVGLPLLVRGMPAATVPNKSQRQAAQNAAHAAVRESLNREINALERVSNAEAERVRQDTVPRILSALEDALQISAASDSDVQIHNERLAEIRMHRAALEAARNAIAKLAVQRTISDALAREMIERLDADELRL